MSNYVVLARFGNQKDKEVMKLNTALSGAGYIISEWPFHITMAAYENLDINLLCEWTSEFALMHKKQKISFSSVSILPPGGEHTETAVLCLNPAHSKKFVDFYYDFHEKNEEYCTGIGSLNSIAEDQPIMHATIATVGIKEMQKALELIFSENVFGEAEMNALEIYTYPMKMVKRFALM